MDIQTSRVADKRSIESECFYRSLAKFLPQNDGRRCSMFTTVIIIIGFLSAGATLLWSALRSTFIDRAFALWKLPTRVLWICGSFALVELAWVFYKLVSGTHAACRADVTTIFAGKISLAAQFAPIFAFVWSNTIVSGNLIREPAAQRRYLSSMASYVTIGYVTFLFGTLSFLVDFAVKISLHTCIGQEAIWSSPQWMEHTLHFLESQEYNIVILAIGLGLFGAVDALMLTAKDIDEGASEVNHHLNEKVEVLQQALNAVPQATPEATRSFLKKLSKGRWF